MPDQNHIVIQGLCQNNLKNISLKIPKQKLVVFTGVSGSGKSSVVFDTIAAESQRQMNETYSAYVRGRLPKYEKPKAERIENLSPSVIIDQNPLGGNARSTVGTISDMYSALRLLYSRIGEPHVGTPSCFSFNNPGGMCPECSGLGKVMTLDVLPLIKEDKSWNEGMVELPTFRVGNWYWKRSGAPCFKKWAFSFRKGIPSRKSGYPSFAGKPPACMRGRQTGGSCVNVSESGIRQVMP